VLSAGCFSGADANGLPCVQDDECGQGVSCVEGFCGGPPPTTGVATGSSGPTGETSTTDMPSTGASSESTGPGPGCGNGVLDEGEDCDDMGESATCNANCTPATCGDGIANVSAGEECDEPGGDPFYAACTEYCQASLFFDELDTDDKWELGLPDVGGALLDDVHVWQLDNNVWQTGLYACESGSADLTFETEIALDAPKGMKPELRFRHRHLFDDCGKTGDGPDGGAVYVLAGGDEAALPFGDTINDSNGACAPPNPLSAVSGFDRDTNGEFEEATANLELWNTQSIKIRFRVGYDCGNCGYDCLAPDPVAPDGFGWQINRVGVAYVPL